jgi:hypothetical protein
MESPQENGRQNPPNNGTQNPQDNSNNSETESTCGNQIQIPQCPPQLETEHTEPIFTPINVEICPIVNVKILKPKFCVQNQANTKPNCFLE